MKAQWPHFWIHLGKNNSALIRYIPSAERGANCEDLWYDFLSLRPECELVHGRSYEPFTDAAPLVLEVAYRGMVRFERRLARSSQHTIGPVVLQLPERGLLGVVVITGSLGGLGLVTAEACVELVNISKVHERWLHVLTPLRRDNSALIRFILSAERGGRGGDHRRSGWFGFRGGRDVCWTCEHIQGSWKVT
jgi:hypothetical protein